MASGQLYNGSILCSFLSENNMLFRRTVSCYWSSYLQLILSHWSILSVQSLLLMVVLVAVNSVTLVYLVSTITPVTSRLIQSGHTGLSCHYGH